MRPILATVITVVVLGCTTAPIAHPSPNAAPERIGLERGADTCGARSYSHLLGQPVSQSPPHSANRNLRVAADDGGITDDFYPQRLNIFYNQQTGRIIGIKCG